MLSLRTINLHSIGSIKGKDRLICFALSVGGVSKEIKAACTRSDTTSVLQSAAGFEPNYIQVASPPGLPKLHLYDLFNNGFSEAPTGNTTTFRSARFGETSEIGSKRASS